MTERERIQAAVDDLLQRGLDEGLVSPPLYKLAWWFGSKVPPPHFQNLRQAVWTHVVGLGGLSLLVLSLHLMIRDPNLPMHYIWITLLLINPLLALLVSLVVGFASGAYYRFQARKLGLPLWRDYHPDRFTGGEIGNP